MTRDEKHELIHRYYLRDIKFQVFERCARTTASKIKVNP